MKVVLFCGGLGTRLREHSDTVPKSLVNIGIRPILWHLMRYYAHYGHKEFILCLGYRGDMIREYFLNYNDALSNDFTLSDGGRHVELHQRDMEDWKITFVDTGLHTNIGQRLLRVRKYLGEDPMFLANYSDGLSDLPLDRQLDEFKSRNTMASFVAVSNLSVFVPRDAHRSGRRLCQASAPSPTRNCWSTGASSFRKEIFNYINEGDELVEQPFQRLIAARQAERVPLERLLAVHGHLQGQDYI